MSDPAANGSSRLQGDPENLRAAIAAETAALRALLPSSPEEIKSMAESSIAVQQKMLEDPNVMALLSQPIERLNDENRAQVEKFRASWYQLATTHLETLRHLASAARVFQPELTF